jgi:hypothetical protein
MSDSHKPFCAICRVDNCRRHQGIDFDREMLADKVAEAMLSDVKYPFYLQGKPTLPNGKKNPEFEAWHWQKVDA